MLSTLWVPREFAGEDGTAAVSGLSASNLGDCGKDLSGHPHFPGVCALGLVTLAAFGVLINTEADVLLPSLKRQFTEGRGYLGWRMFCLAI